MSSIHQTDSLTNAQRIDRLLEHTGLNARSFAFRIGLKHPDTIYHIQRGRNGISERLAERIIEVFPEVAKGWLRSGEGQMLRSDPPEETSGTVVRPIRTRATDIRVERQRVPLYDFEATAGLTPIFTNQNVPIDYLSIPDLPRCDGAVYVRGDSMYPLLKAGDIVMYKQIQDFHNIIWGEMYLISFSYEGEEYITVKFIKKIEGRPDYVLLVSHNPHHAPKEIPIQAIRALAMIKASVRFNTMG